MLPAEFMYSHIEQAAEVCAEEAETFLIDGFELAPWYRDRLRADLPGIEVRACFLGHETFSAVDLADHHGPKPQHEATMSVAELEAAAAWMGHEADSFGTSAATRVCSTSTSLKPASRPP